ncbi:arginine--tRNA ligase [Candidatus Pacearchaeota archaeon]|nr:arginine--tRNA ligase [Candidatus Pacearchaeota archaeon]
MKKFIIKLLAKETNLKTKELENLIEIPPSDNLGDYAIPCFILSKKLKKSPIIIAEELVKKLRKSLPKEVSNTDFKGPYVNFFIDKKILAENVLEKVKQKNFGKLNIDKKKIGIEYPSPNTNKALHVGHLRNMAIGESICKIMDNTRNKVIHLNLFNDRGILISKSMIGYEKFAEGKTPESENIKEDKFVGDLYIKFSKASSKNEKLEKLAQEKLKLWEKGDKKTIALWKKLNSWTYSGMQKTFDKFGLSKIDKNYYESEIYKKGKELIKTGLKNKVFYNKEDGAVAINLEKEKLGEKILLRSDGTSVYITQDLYLAEQKIKDFNLDSSYYIVGCDQEYHFKVLFSILEKLGLKKDWKHLSYGMVSLPEGKMKSREGTAISADDLITETQEIAKKGIESRATEKLNKKELEDRSLKIALSAIKYSLLKVDIRRGIIFNPNEALAFEGDTGPYLLYSYARASSILKKVKNKKTIKILDLKDTEIKLLKKINSFEDTITKAYENLAPNLIANYAFELSQIFNEFYHDCPVLGSIEEGFRLKLVNAFRITLKKSLDLLGIDVLEEM